MSAVELSTRRPDSRRACAAGQRTTAPTVGRFVRLGATFDRTTGRRDKPLTTSVSAPARGRAHPCVGHHTIQRGA